MALNIKRPNGTEDVIPKNINKWHTVENIAKDVASMYGFKEIRIPTFENTELFQRSVGETTDVVQKEMYTVIAKETKFTLRPEGTAGTIRAMMQNGLLNEAMPQKVFYILSCFRHERPQAGRLREFHQFGVEMAGSSLPSADADIISMANDIINMLEIKNLTKIYPNGKKAVSDLSITIEDGDLYGFIGKNGAGKTTTLKACLTIHDYDTGDILLNGVSIKSAPTECKKLMAYVPDTPILDPYLTGLQYLNFICDIYSVSKEKRQQKIPALSKKLGMYEKLNDLISSYSHGMKQKVSLIGAFIHEPKLLILDEPFVALDPEAFIQLKELMKELCASGGSVLFSSHILDVVEKTCNKIAIIRNGELIRSGETKEILGNRDLENVFMELNGK